MLWHKFCINCVSDSNSFNIYKNIDTKFPLKKDYQFAITICEKCGLMFSNPQPSIDNLNTFYRSNDSNKSLNSYPNFKNTLEKKNKYKRLIFMPFIEKNIGLLKNSTILDIGSDTGWWLGQFDKSNKLIGVELSSANAKRASSFFNVRTIKKPWSQNLVDHNSVDLITCMHTLEHFIDPVDALISCNKALKIGGYIHIQVPSPFGLVFRRGIDFAFKPYHLFYFSQEVLKSLLSQTGFEILDSRELRSSRYGRPANKIFDPGIFSSGITEVIAKKNIDSYKTNRENMIIDNLHSKKLLKSLKYSENLDRYFILIDNLKKMPILGIFIKVVYKISVKLFGTHWNQDQMLNNIMENWGELND